MSGFKTTTTTTTQLNRASWLSS